MKSAKVRLVVSAALFFAWIGYLVYLAATTTRPVVLSRPQFLAADLYVVARLTANLKGDAPVADVKVVAVVWSKSGEDLAGKEITVQNLPQCRRDYGWIGAGKYILALTLISEKDHVYEVTPIPRSPGYAAFAPDTRIYPATAETLRQLELIREAYHANKSG